MEYQWNGIRIEMKAKVKMMQLEGRKSEKPTEIFVVNK